MSGRNDPARLVELIDQGADHLDELLTIIRADGLGAAWAAARADRARSGVALLAALVALDTATDALAVRTATTPEQALAATLDTTRRTVRTIALFAELDNLGRPDP